MDAVEYLKLRNKMLKQHLEDGFKGTTVAHMRLEAREPERAVYTVDKYFNGKTNAERFEEVFGALSRLQSENLESWLKQKYEEPKA